MLKRKTKSLGRSYRKLLRFLNRSYPVLIVLGILFTTLFSGVAHARQTDRDLRFEQELVESQETLIQERRTLFKLRQYETQVERLRQRESQLEVERQRLEKELQTKRERALGEAVYAGSPVAPSGSCTDWIRRAGVDDVANAYELIMRESGCSTSAVNPTSGACGIPQALPCSKLTGRGNPVAEIKWMTSYIMERYGSWANANAFQKSRGWY